MQQGTGYSLHGTRKRGVVALATVLLLGAVLTEVALAGVFVVYVLNTSGLSARLSAAALAAAQSGVDDALLRLVRDKNFLGSYPISLTAESSANVTIALMPDAAQRAITSTGTVGLRQRRMQAVALVDGITGEVHLLSSQEISL